MNYSKGICKTLKAANDRISVIEIINLSERIDMKNDFGKIAKQASKQASNAECRLGNLNGATGGSYAGQVYDQDYLCPTLTDMQGGGRQPHIVEVEKLDIEQQIVAMRGINPDNPSDRTPALTTANIPSVIELGNPDFYNFIYEIDGELYLIRIRKLTPKECWRLMDFSDEDFEKAAAVNSNTQLYKQAGNSIVKNVLVAIMGQLFEGKEDVYRKV